MPIDASPSTTADAVDSDAGEQARIADQAATQYAADTAVRALKIELVRVWLGGAEMRMTIVETMVNAHRITHGGFAFLLADTTFAYAYGTRSPRPITRNADVAFLATSTAGDVLTAVASEKYAAGRTVVYDVTVRRNSGAVVGEFRFHGRTPARPVAVPASSGEAPLDRTQARA